MNSFGAFTKYCQSRWYVIGIAGAWLFVASSAAAQNSAREEMQETYKTQRGASSSFFGGAPINHIIPKRDNISFGVQAEQVDVAIAPANLKEIPDDNFQSLDHRLEMTGWSASPLVAFSAQKFGMGFTADTGRRQILYVNKTNGFTEQYSDMKYSGAGIFAFALLRSSELPNWLAGNFIVGAKSVTAVEETDGTRSSIDTVPEATKIKYGVTTYDVGLDIAATLAKRFTVLPWVNYRKTTLGALRDRNETAASGLDPDLRASVELDRAFTWQSDPELTYGIDFAVQIAQFEVHLGGAFGYFESLNRGSDRIQDKSLELSVGYDIKSH